MKKLLLTVLHLFLSNTLIFAQQNDDRIKLIPQKFSSKQHIALFNGATTNFSHKTTSYTIGLDYEYRFSKLIGLGILGEYILAKPEEMMAGVVLFTHPFKGTKFIAAPLVVYSDDPHSVGGGTKKEADFAFRIGAGYDFHIRKLSIGPAINFDIGKTEAINYGLSMGYGF